MTSFLLLFFFFENGSALISQPGPNHTLRRYRLPWEGHPHLLFYGLVMKDFLHFMALVFNTLHFMNM